jgi:hypothetical protein
VGARRREKSPDAGFLVCPGNFARLVAIRRTSLRVHSCAADLGGLGPLSRNWSALRRSECCRNTGKVGDVAVAAAELYCPQCVTLRMLFPTCLGTRCPQSLAAVAVKTPLRGFPTGVLALELFQRAHYVGHCCSTRVRCRIVSLIRLAQPILVLKTRMV